MTQLLAEEGRGEQDQRDDDRVLEDDREAVRHAVDAQRVDEEEDRRVDERGGERELGEARRAGPACPARCGMPEIASATSMAT